MPVRTLRTELHIHAPVERVWDKLVDFAAYGAWNPLIRRMRARAEVGSHADFTIVLGERRVAVKSTIIAVDLQRELAMTGRSAVVRPLFDGVHFWRLEADGDGTRLVHGEDFSGALLPLLWWWLEPRLLSGYAQMNRALAAEVE